MRQMHKFMNPKPKLANPVWMPLRQLSIFILTLFLCFAANAQNKVITGTILTADDSQPLIGATVVEKGTTNATITDADGKYKLSLKGDNASIVVSYMGYLNETVEVGTQSNIEVKMVQDLKSIDEVVVVGYGTQTKGKLTGSVAQIKGDDLLTSKAPNISNALVGRLPGLIAIGQSGTPGSDGAKIRIRGSGTMNSQDALIVVDGVAEPDFGFDRIDPNDIESFTVLKDAAAAIYGARAANGVILITTKKGKSGTTSFNYSYNQGFTQPAMKPLLANSYELATYYNDYKKEEDSTNPPRYSADDLEKLKTGADPRHDLANTDWWDVAIRQWTPTNRQSLCVQGGSSEVKYYLSGGLVQQENIFKNSASGYNQMNYRSNIDAQLNKYLKIGVNLSGRSEKQELPNTASERDAWMQVITTNPMFPVNYGPEQYWQGMYTVGLTPPLVGTTVGGIIKNNKEVYNNIFNFKLDIPFIQGLSVDGFAAIDMSSEVNRNSKNPYLVYILDEAHDSVIQKNAGNATINVNETHSTSKSITLNYKINYARSFGNINLNAFVGYEQNRKTGSYLYVSRYNLQTQDADLETGDDIGQIGSGGTDLPDVRRNLISRISLDYDSKYLFDFNFRTDQSRNFPPGRRTGYFPGFSVAWRASKESFIKDNFSFIDELKVRASWGQLGNDAVEPLQYLTTYQLKTGGDGYYFGTATTAARFKLNVDPNPFITWEVANTANIGLNLNIFKDLFVFDADAFYSKRSNILIGGTTIQSIPLLAGLNPPSQNVGKMNNKGIELSLTHNNKIGDLKYSVNANYTFARNTVVYQGEAPNLLGYQKQEGTPYGSSLYYPTDGLYTKQDSINNYPKSAKKIVPGDIKYLDYNGDSVINDKDRVINKKPTEFPEIIYGISLNLSYKGVDFSVLFQGAGNIYKYLSLDNVRGARGNYYKEVITGAYSESNQGGKYPRAFMNDPKAAVNDFFLKNAAYLRCKTMEIGYSLPVKYTKALKIKNLRIYANGTNLFFIMNKLKYVDPEMTSDIGAYYPQQRIISFGASLTL